MWCYGVRLEMLAWNAPAPVVSVFCDNAVDEQNIADETEDYFPDWNFLDAFN